MEQNKFLIDLQNIDVIDFEVQILPYLLGTVVVIVLWLYIEKTNK